MSASRYAAVLVLAAMLGCAATPDTAAMAKRDAPAGTIAVMVAVPEAELRYSERVWKGLWREQHAAVANFGAVWDADSDLAEKAADFLATSGNQARPLASMIAEPDSGVVRRELSSYLWPMQAGKKVSLGASHEALTRAGVDHVFLFFIGAIDVQVGSPGGFLLRSDCSLHLYNVARREHVAGAFYHLASRPDVESVRELEADKVAIVREWLSSDLLAMLAQEFDLTKQASGEPETDQPAGGEG